MQVFVFPTLHHHRKKRNLQLQKHLFFDPQENASRQSFLKDDHQFIVSRHRLAVLRIARRTTHVRRSLRVARLHGDVRCGCGGGSKSKGVYRPQYNVEVEAPQRRDPTGRR